MRHVLRNRAALTRPNFGTAIRMSITFAVDTYSGGLPRIVTIWVRPSLRSFFSLARRTLTSFARLSASILWSSERRGACACVLAGAIGSADLTNVPVTIKLRLLSRSPGFFRQHAHARRRRLVGQ